MMSLRTRRAKQSRVRNDRLFFSYGGAICNRRMCAKKTKKKMWLNDPIAFLESQWPGKPSREIKEAFAALKGILKKEAPKGRERAEAGAPPKHFNILDVVRRTCATHDFLFLSRQLTYHIAAAAETRRSSGRESQIEAIISELIGHIARRAPRGSQIDIEIKETTLKQNPAVELLFRAADEKTEGLDKTAFLKQLSESPIIACKEALLKEGGQFSADLPEPRRPVFKVVLKTIEAERLAAGDHEVFKYDIAIKNITSVRKRFGIKKSQSLVHQIEEFVRLLVRHPIDIVTSMYDRGIITAIYETQKGAAQSVAGRISSRLGAEKFKIGKMQVDLDFGYRLSALPAIPLKRIADTSR